MARSNLWSVVSSIRQLASYREQVQEGMNFWNQNCAIDVHGSKIYEMRHRAAPSEDKEIQDLPVQRIIRRADGRCLF